MTRAVPTKAAIQTPTTVPMEMGSTFVADDEFERDEGGRSDADSCVNVGEVVRVIDLVGANGGAVACGRSPEKVESNTRVEEGAMRLEAVLTPERFVGTARGSEVGC
jgi:hypothetical protein